MKKIFSIELTNYCNLSGLCRQMCPHHKMTRPKGMMKTPLGLDIIDYAAKSGQTDIQLAGFGEPFLHPDWDMFVLDAKSHGLGILIPTNMSCLGGANEGKLRFLKDVVIQADIDDCKVSDWSYFSRMVRKLNDAGARVVLTGTSVSEKREVRARRLARLLCINLAIGPQHDWHGSYGTAKGDQRRWGKFDICPAVNHDTYSILWDGTIVPCCLVWDGEVRLGQWGDLDELSHGYYPYDICKGCHMVWCTEESMIGLGEMVER